MTPREVVRIASMLGMVAMSWTAFGQTREMDREKSVLTVRVYKTGLFSAFAHDHEIRAFIQSGGFDEQKRSVEFQVKSGELKVIDPGASENERSTVQHTMLGPKVLDSERFSLIQFHSTSVAPAGEGKWTVQGDLTLHGQTRPVRVDVQGAGGHYRGTARLLQTQFGMVPVSIGGGAVKVKDEVRIEFEIAGK